MKMQTVSNQTETVTSNCTFPAQSNRRRSRQRLARIVEVGLSAALAMGMTAARGAGPAPAPATQPAPTADSGPSNFGPDLFTNLSPDGRLHLLLGKSFVMKTNSRFKRVNISHPEVLQDNEIASNSILLKGIAPGSTQLILWDENEREQMIDVVVEIDLAAVDLQLKRLFPDSKIQVIAVNDTLILKGRVPSLQVAEEVTNTMSSYGKVLNMMEVSGGQQIMLKVKFAEISRSASTELGLYTDFLSGKSVIGFQNGPAAASAGVFSQNGSGASPPSGASIFGGTMLGKTAFDGLLDALRQNSLLRTLAEPNQVTYSGVEAQFIAGGEFPVPIPQPGGGGTAITVDYKQYGVRLTFVPVALGDGKIRLKVSPEVSDLDYGNAISFNGFTIPALIKRSLSTTVELREGQTLALAGLLQTKLNSNASFTPGLGDIPILGTLFRSVRYQRSETELMVMVTPQFVEALNPGEAPEFPGEHWRIPSENELFLHCALGGPASAPTRNVVKSDKATPVNFYGPFGFNDAGH